MNTQETFTPCMRKAIRFAVTTHEVDQKQERKGKGTSYISHPMTVGLILAKAGASEDVVAAGILHDTVEDSVASNKVTYELLTEAFNENVATLVLSVTEENKSLSWEERKAEALLHIASFSHDSVLVKSADILSNCTELVDDFNEVGDEVFTRFNRGREAVLTNYINVADALQARWPDSPLGNDLSRVGIELARILALGRGYLQYAEWNISFIEYEMEHVFDSSSYRSEIISLCEEFHAAVRVYEEDRNKEAFDANARIIALAFDCTITDTLKTGHIDEHMLLVTHVADLLYALNAKQP